MWDLRVTQSSLTYTIFHAVNDIHAGGTRYVSNLTENLSFSVLQQYLKTTVPTFCNVVLVVSTSPYDQLLR